MNRIVATVVSEDVKPATFLPAAGEGKVKFHIERGSKGGTGFRRLQFLAPGTAERAAAEAVVAKREQGVTMKAIAAELHVSVPTVRRMITALLVTTSTEAQTQADFAAVLAAAKAEEPTSV
jgi:DNA-binding NarL/FixJ family response regulator